MALKKLKNAKKGDTVKLETPEYEWDEENKILVSLKAVKDKEEHPKSHLLARKAGLEAELEKVNALLAEIEANEV